jgi:hypothetical protein
VISIISWIAEVVASRTPTVAAAATAAAGILKSSASSKSPKNNPSLSLAITVNVELVSCLRKKKTKTPCAQTLKKKTPQSHLRQKKKQQQQQQQLLLQGSQYRFPRA